MDGVSSADAVRQAPGGGPLAGRPPAGQAPAGRPPAGRPPAGGPPAAAPAGARPPLVRPREGRIVGGVATGLADHLGIPVRVVRIGLFVAAVAGGFGVVLYGWLWALVPAVDTRRGAVPAAPTAPARSASTTPSTPAAPRRAGVHTGDLLAGAALLVVGVLLIGQRMGWPVRLPVVLPLVIIVTGATVAYSQLDEVERARWAVRAGVGTRAAAVRLIGGLALVVLGVLVAVVPRIDPGQLTATLVAVLAVLAGAALVLAPWGLRLWRELGAERAATARESERADIAALLHDSVLQTLALIQRRSGDPVEVTRLARAQERDLRGWLYGGGTPAEASTVATRVAAVVAEVEDLHGVAIDVVTVGDQPLDPHAAALVAALREAVLNAARHAGGTAIQVYVECGPDGVEAFVRDRGPGFDPGDVPGDRLGVKESIIGRMERHGGSARLRSEPGEGTEVKLLLPGADRQPATAPVADREEQEEQT